MQKKKDHIASDRSSARPLPQPRWVGTSSASVIHKLPSSLSGKNHFPLSQGSVHVVDPAERTSGEERSKPENRTTTSTGQHPTLSAHSRSSNFQSYSGSSVSKCSKYVYQILPSKPTIVGQSSYTQRDKLRCSQSLPFSSFSRDLQSHYVTSHYFNSTKHKHSTLYGSEPELFPCQTPQTNKEYNNTCACSPSRNSMYSSTRKTASFLNRSAEEYPQAYQPSSNFSPPSPCIYRSNSSLELRVPQDKDAKSTRDQQPCVSTFQDEPQSGLIRSPSVKRSEFKLYLKRSTKIERGLTNTVIFPERLHEASSTDDHDKLDEACSLSVTDVEKTSISPGFDSSIPSDLLEDRLTLHVPSVRRKSGCSVSSQRSSNADSAVDLRTPEDESLDISVEEPLSTFSAVHQWKCEADSVHSSKRVKPEVLHNSSYDWPKENSIGLLNKYDDSHLSLVPDNTLTPFTTTPFVIVSDHSSPSLSKPCNTDYRSQVVGQFPDQTSSYLTASYADGSTNRRHFRKLSDSSDSSVGSEAQSVVSTSTYMSTEDQTDTVMFVQPSSKLVTSKKQSSWKKIKNVIHWTPFVQHFKKHHYPWVQLAGHKGNFLAGEDGAILKKLNQKEHKSLPLLMADILRPYVPEYRGDVERDGETYVLMQDLLAGFKSPCVMDVKMGVRTYLEDELEKARQNPKLRKDMYQKMVEICPDAPTPEERAAGAITKPRYMQWRETISSSSSLCFRIEGIKKGDGTSSKDFKTTRTREQVKEALKSFIGDDKTLVGKYLRRLKAIRATQETSEFFANHELVGSSLLFVHDASGQGNIWMIDFGKTTPLPEGVHIDHRSEWKEGNHEDGYLRGVDNLVSILEEL